MPVVGIIYSDSLNPYVNLAREVALFEGRAEVSKAAMADHYLLLYRNRPSVVIGRHQNPWRECDLAAMEDDGVSLVRRISGGGAVYHDEGNCNWCFVSRKQAYDRDHNFAVVLQALKNLGIDGERSGRNDIIVDDRKVSGSAFKVGRDWALHHGTMLVDADLQRLLQYLTAPDRNISSMGVESVRSRVLNLRQLCSGLGVETWMEAMRTACQQVFGEVQEVAADFSQLNTADASILNDWEWQFGKTPDFVHTVEQNGQALGVQVHRGRIKGVQLNGSNCLPALVGRRYCRKDLDAVRQDCPGDPVVAGKLAADLLRKLIDEIW